MTSTHTPLASVLVADHEALARRRLRDALEYEGFIVREATDGRALLSHMQHQIPHLVVMDLDLPFLGGLELCRRVRQHGDVAVVVFTAADDEETRIRALDLYAEDYIRKPASYREVAVRVKRILRRTWLSCPPPPGVRVDEHLSLDFLRREVRTPRGTFRLTPMESRLLQLLVRNAGQVLPTELLLERVWGDACVPVNSLWEYVRRIRHKIGDPASKPRYILNEPGLGYRFRRPVVAVTVGYQYG